MPWILLLMLAGLTVPALSPGALPKRLVLALDGVAYRDMKALQDGVTYRDLAGREFHRQAFANGYCPVSRLVSTFPSASDVAWTEILGNRPLPGYQRTYFNEAANAEIFQNGITTTMEYERQMTWQVSSDLLRTLAFIFPRLSFKYEVHELFRNFLQATNGIDTYYALLRSPDDAQHLSADILAMLSTLDQKLQELRAVYRAREGRELEILILSDHGNNHAGPAKRVRVRAFLRQAGYHLTSSIHDPRDVVLPTAGIESWVEIHNAPSETARLLGLLTHLEGVDVLTARHPLHPNQFVVMNSAGEQALIEWNPEHHTFRYTPRLGDPLDYCPVVEALSKKGQLNGDGFASADAWMAATLLHRYPLALERIARGHTRGALNPATILISLNNAYVHSGWCVKRGSEMVRFGGTHGALDDLNSVGILLSSFVPTPDTSANRVASLFDGFKGMRDYHAEEAGAEWVTAQGEALAAGVRTALLATGDGLARDGVFLRVWSSSLAHVAPETAIDVTVRNMRHSLRLPNQRGDHEPNHASEQHLTLTLPVVVRDHCASERIYALPSSLVLEPGSEYSISGRLRDHGQSKRIFSLTFRTDPRGLPAAY